MTVKEEHIYRVKDAIEDLQLLNPELPLVLSSDEEGNNVRMVNSIGIQHVKELEHQFMECVADEDLVYYSAIKVAEVW